MTHFSEKRDQEKNRTDERAGGVMGNQNGSVIILVLMVLVIMTVIGIVSSDTLVTENFIIRNVGISKQNNNMVDSILMEGLQRFMQISDADEDNFTTNGPNGAWIIDMNSASEFDNSIWYQAEFSQPALSAANAATSAVTFPLLTTRGEADGNLRYAVVGFEPVDLGNLGSEQVTVGSGPNWRQGRIVGEYVSDSQAGLLRMEIGVKRRW